MVAVCWRLAAGGWRLGPYWVYSVSVCPDSNTSAGNPTRYPAAGAYAADVLGGWHAAVNKKAPANLAVDRGLMGSEWCRAVDRLEDD